VREGFTVQGNLLERDTCWPAMAVAYEEALAAGEPFVERLLRALEAAEREGGDVRGRQSAAIMLADATLHPAAWRGRLMNLRIEDHPDPVPELRRIVTMYLAYELTDDEGEAAKAGPAARAARSTGSTRAERKPSSYSVWNSSDRRVPLPWDTPPT
jgi:uncharacterized Ntn-hydrolase superfamily protein